MNPTATSVASAMFEFWPSLQTTPLLCVLHQQAAHTLRSINVTSIPLCTVIKTTKDVRGKSVHDISQLNFSGNKKRQA